MTFNELVKRARENTVCKSCGHNSEEAGPINTVDGLCDLCYEARRQERIRSRGVEAIISRRKEQ